MIYTTDNTPSDAVVLVDGRKIENAFYVDTQTGLVKCYTLPLEYNRVCDSISHYEIHARKAEVLVPLYSEKIYFNDYQKSLLKVIEDFTVDHLVKYSYLSGAQQIAEYNTIMLSIPRHAGKTTIANYLHNKYKSELFTRNNKPDLTKHRGKKSNINLFIFDDVTYSTDIIYDYVANMISYGFSPQNCRIILLETRRCR